MEYLEMREHRSDDRYGPDRSSASRKPQEQGSGEKDQGDRGPQRGDSTRPDRRVRQRLGPGGRRPVFVTTTGATIAALALPLRESGQTGGANAAVGRSTNFGKRLAPESNRLAPTAGLALGAPELLPAERAGFCNPDARLLGQPNYRPSAAVSRGRPFERFQGAGDCLQK